MSLIDYSFILLITGFVVVANSKLQGDSSSISFCDDYVRCMEQLEIKQHECLSLDRNVRLRSNNDCTRQKWDKKLELNALHMRRAEIARDCVQKYHLDSDIAESTLDEESRKQCISLHDKFQFARNSTSTVTRKKRSNSKRTKRESKKNNSKSSECRHAAKIWHRQCSALAKCCPLTDECKQSTKEIMEQIYEGRHKLHDLHNNNCLY